MPDEIPEAVWSGTFTIWGIEMKCYVLDNGQRVIEQESFQRFMDALADGAPCFDEESLLEFARFARWRDSVP